MLGGSDDGASFGQPAGGVEQAEQDAVGADADEIVEIARHATAVVDRGQFGPVQFGDVRVDRIVDRSRQTFFKMEERSHRKPRREVTTKLIQKQTDDRLARCAHSMKIGKNGRESSGKGPGGAVQSFVYLRVLCGSSIFTSSTTKDTKVHKG